MRRMLEDFPLLLLHDNARPHTSNNTNETLRNFKWEVLEMSEDFPQGRSGNEGCLLSQMNIKTLHLRWNTLAKLMHYVNKKLSSKILK
jgi:hypothetical protein